MLQRTKCYTELNVELVAVDLENETRKIPYVKVGKWSVSSDDMELIPVDPTNETNKKPILLRLVSLNCPLTTRSSQFTTESSQKRKRCRIISSSDDDGKEDSLSKKERKDHPTKHMNIKKDKNAVANHHHSIVITCLCINLLKCRVHGQG